MLAPMIVLGGLCVIFGVVNSLPLGRLIEPAVGAGVTQGESFAGFPSSLLLVGLTLAVLAAACLNHAFGVRRTGKGLGAVDHIHYAPGLHSVYNVAEKGRLDPYNLGRSIVWVAAHVLFRIDRLIDWVYSTLATKSALGVTWLLRRAHDGNLNRYILWSIAGAVAVILFVFAFFGGGR
jgi:NADH-quinone oxidoreductase subunit L